MRTLDQPETKSRGKCCCCFSPGSWGGIKAGFLSFMRFLFDSILLYPIYCCFCCCFFPYVDEQLRYDDELVEKNEQIKTLKDKVDVLTPEEPDESSPFVEGTKDSSRVGRAKRHLKESEIQKRHQKKRIEEQAQEIAKLRRQLAAKNETSLLETSRPTTTSRRHERRIDSAPQQQSLEEVNKMEEEIRKLSSELEQTEQKLSKARDKERKTRQTLQSEINSLGRRNDSLQRENDSLREQMDQSFVGTENTEVLKMTEEIQELKRSIETKDAKIRDLEQTIMAAKREKYELETELNEAHTQSISGSSPQKIAELENAVSAYKEENERLKREKTEQKEKIDRLSGIIVPLQDEVDKNREMFSRQAAQLADREREIQEMKEASNPTQSNSEIAALHRQLDELRGRLQANKYGSGKFKGPPETKAFIEGMIATEVTDALDELEDAGCEPEVAQEVVFRTISAYYRFLQQQRDRVFENVRASHPLLNNCIASQLGDAVWPYVQDAFVATREAIDDAEFLQEFFTENGIEGIDRMGDEYRDLYFAEEAQKNAMQSYVEACGKLCFYIVWSKGNRMTLEPTGNNLIQEQYSPRHFALMFGGKIDDGAPVNVVFPALYLPDDERESAFFPGAVIERGTS